MITRPTVATQQYWDLHITYICVAYNVPKMLVMPYSLQGTVTRADLDICTASFREDFEIVRELCETVYEWQGKWANDYDTDFKPEKYQNVLKPEVFARSRWVQDKLNPLDAHTCLIRPPRAPNVDIGYTAKALEIELQLGVKVPQDVFADSGKDWRTQSRQKAEYLAYVKSLAKEFDVDAAQITSLATEIEDPNAKPDAPENGESETSPEARYA